MKNKFFFMKNQVQSPKMLADILPLSLLLSKNIQQQSPARSFHYQRLSDVLDPINPQDAVNLSSMISYVDNVKSNIDSELIQMKTTLETAITDIPGTVAKQLNLVTPELLGAIPITGGDLLGTLRLKNNAIITGLANPTHGSDAVNLSTMIAYVDAINSSITLEFQNLKAHFEHGTFDSSAVNIQEQLASISPELIGAISVLGGNVTGSLHMLNNSTVTGLADPVHDSDAVNLSSMVAYVNSEIEQIKTTFGQGHAETSDNFIEQLSYLSPELLGAIPIWGGDVTGTLNMTNNATITGLIDPIKDSDAVNLKYLNNHYKIFIANKNSVTDGVISLGEDTILTGLKDPVNPSDAVNLITLDKRILTISASSLQALPLTGGTMKGNINFASSGSITGLRNPFNPTDAVNLQSLEEKMKTLSTNLQTLLPITLEGKAKKNIDMGNYLLSGISDPSSPTDAVNLRFLTNSIQNALKNIFVSSNSTTIEKNPFGNIDMNDIFTIQRLRDPIDDQDAVNLRFLNSTLSSLQENIEEAYTLSSVIASSCLPLTGGTMIGNLDLDGKYSITGLADPIHDQDAVNLHYLTKTISALVINSTNSIETPANYLPLTGGSLFGSVNLGNTYTISGLADPQDPCDAVNLKTLEDTISILNASLAENLALTVLNNIPNSVLSSEGKASSNIDMGDRFTITGLTFPKNPSDAVSFDYVNKKLSLISATTLQALPLSGGTLSGNLNLNGHSLTGLALPKQPSDAINLSYLTETLKEITIKQFPALPITGGVLSGTLDLSGNTLTGLPQPKEPSDAVNLEFVKNTIKTISNSSLNVLSLSGGTLSGNLNLNGYTITGLANPINPTDAATVAYVSDSIRAISSKTLNVLPLSGGVLSGNLDLQGYSLTGIPTPYNPMDAVNLEYLKESLRSLNIKHLELLPLSGGILSGSLDLSGNSITGLREPTNPSDAISLSYLTKMLKNFPALPLSGGALSGTIDLQSIGTVTGLTNPVNPTDAVNLQTLEDRFSMFQKILKLPSNTQAITAGNLDFCGLYTISGLVDPVNPRDAVNLQTLLNSLANINASSLGVLSTKGGTVTGAMNFSATVTLAAPLYMNGNFVTNIHDPFIGGDAVNLRYLQSNYLPLTGGSLQGDINLNNRGTVTGLNNPIRPTDAVNLQTLDMRITRVSQQFSNLQIPTTPVNPTDIITLSSLTNSLNNFASSLNVLSLSGGSMQGMLDMNSLRIKNLANPIDPKDGVNLATLLIYISQITPGTVGALSSSGGLIHGSIDLGASETTDGYTITGLANPKTPTDAVNLRTLNLMLQNLVPSPSTSFTNPITSSINIQAPGSINMNGAPLTGIPTPTSDTDAVNMKYVKDLLDTKPSLNQNSSQYSDSQNYLSTSGIVTAFMINSMEPFSSVEISEEVRLGWYNSVSRVRSSSSAYRYFSLEGLGNSSLMLYKPALYSLSISLSQEVIKNISSLVNLMVMDDSGPVKLSSGDLSQSYTTNINSLWAIQTLPAPDIDNYFYVTLSTPPNITKGLLGWNIIAYDWLF